MLIKIIVVVGEVVIALSSGLILCYGSQGQVSSALPPPLPLKTACVAKSLTRQHLH